MPANWKRRAWVVVDGLRVEGLRLKFKVKKSIESDPNTLSLSIFNLSANTRSTMTKSRAEVVLVAGYEGSEQLLFSGTSRTVDHVKSGTDWVTEVSCGDGELSFGQLSSRSFAPGQMIADLVSAFATDMKLDAKDAVAKLRKGQIPGMDRFIQGYTASGHSVRELDRVVKAAGLEWSIQDGRLEIRAAKEASGETVFVLSARTGLIGSPEHKAAREEGRREGPKLVARCELLGELRPYRRVQIDSLARKGIYRIEAVEHAGDTHGQEWTTTIEARA